MQWMRMLTSAAGGSCGGKRTPRARDGSIDEVFIAAALVALALVPGHRTGNRESASRSAGPRAMRRYPANPVTPMAASRADPECRFRGTASAQDPGVAAHAPNVIVATAGSSGTKNQGLQRYSVNLPFLPGRPIKPVEEPQN